VALAYERDIPHSEVRWEIKPTHYLTSTPVLGCTGHWPPGTVTFNARWFQQWVTMFHAPLTHHPHYQMCTNQYLKTEHWQYTEQKDKSVTPHNECTAWRHSSTDSPVYSHASWRNETCTCEYIITKNSVVIIKRVRGILKLFITSWRSHNVVEQISTFTFSTAYTAAVSLSKKVNSISILPTQHRAAVNVTPTFDQWQSKVRSWNH